ncbi:TetR/AcrR family transcriptional regulator [Candidatus Binatia bacterium]|nr:TetR/AcrR family transcriptional regulator [Candidatus Binatia bacterium]
MMAEQGPAGLTVSDVARRAGVNRGTAYQHFPTRERLVAAVLERVGRGTKELLDATAPASLDARIDATVEHFVGNPELVRLSLFRMLAGIPHPRAELWEGYVERVRVLAASAAAQPDADGDMLAVILLGATMLWSLRVQSGGASAAATRRYLRELKRLMLFGVIRPERHPDVVAAVRRGEVARAAKRLVARKKSLSTPTARRTVRDGGGSDVKNTGAGVRAGRGATS